MKRLVVAATILALALLTALVGCHEPIDCGCPAPDAAAGPRFIGAAPFPSPGTDPLIVASGTTGTVTVAVGYVVQVDAWGGGSGGTVTITPNGPSITDAQAQPAVVIPANQPWKLGRPSIVGMANELGVGTTLVFSGTSGYVVTMSQGGS